MALRSLNNFETTILAAMTSGQLNLIVPNADGLRLQNEVFALSDTIRLTLERGTLREIVTATAQVQNSPVAGQSTVTITRASEKVSAAAATAISHLSGTKLSARMTAADVQANLRNPPPGGGSAPTVVYDSTGGSVTVALANGVVTEVYSYANGSSTYNFTVALAANALYMATIYVGKYGPGSDADVQLNGGALTFDTEIGTGPVGWPGGRIEVRALADASGSGWLYVFRAYLP